MKKNIGIIIIILGIISGLFLFGAGVQLNKTGSDMKTLRSEGGTSLAEVYYQDVGKMTSNLGELSDGLGVGIITISIGIGAYFIESDKKNIIKNTEEKKAKENYEKLGL